MTGCGILPASVFVAAGAFRQHRARPQQPEGTTSSHPSRTLSSAVESERLSALACSKSWGATAALGQGEVPQAQVQNPTVLPVRAVSPNSQRSPGGASGTPWDLECSAEQKVQGVPGRGLLAHELTASHPGRAAAPLGQAAGPPEKAVAPPESAAEPSENGADPPEKAVAPPENGAESPENGAEPPENPAGPPENPAGTPENPAGPPENPAGPPENPAGPLGQAAGQEQDAEQVH